MSKRIPIFYSALLLTGVNLLLRFAGTSFQIFISRQMGAAGVGLLQLVLSAGNLAMVAGMAGIRTGTMYLSAEELGKKRSGSTVWVLSGCFVYSILFSTAVAIGLYAMAPIIAEVWIGDLRTVAALQLLAAFLPVTCLCGVMTGYFTAENRIGTLAVVEVLEQLFSMAVTFISLAVWARGEPAKACLCVVFGSSAGACLTLLCLTCLRIREHEIFGKRIPVGKRLVDTALPLAVADVTKAGISTAENMMVPKRLSLNTRTVQPLAAFGMVSGMVFPILMFPACILFGLAELLIPELARCAAAGSHTRIRYLVRRSLKTSLLYGFLFSGLMVLFAEPLCIRLYDSPEAGKLLKQYALLIPMLYCDAITDAMTKGLGQQKACVRYNILTSSMDVILLYLLLPEYGMRGYLFSFAITHLLNFVLSFRRLIRISGVIPEYSIAVFGLSAVVASVWGASCVGTAVFQLPVYILLLGSLLTLFQVTGREDIAWIQGLIRKKTG